MKQIFQNDKNALKWLNVAHLVNDVYTGFLNPVMPFLAAKLGFTMALATVLMAITQICSNMLQPIFGFFADNMLKRFFIFWGLLLVSVFIPLIALAPNVFLLTVFMVLGCLGSSFFHPQATGFVNLFSGSECVAKMGVFISMGSLGFAFGPLLSALIVQAVGLEKLVCTTILGVSVALSMFLLVPRLSLNEKKPVQKAFIKSFKDILSNSQIDCLLLISMMKSLVTTSSCILLPFLWKSMGYNIFYIGFAIFLFVFMGALGSFVSPKLEKFFGSKSIIYFSMCATLPLFILFALTYKTMPVFSLLLFCSIGFTTMLAQPIILVWAQRILPEYKSIISGFINGFCWGIIALCLSMLGVVAQNFGIVKVLVVLTIFPVISSYFVKYLKEY